MERILKAVAESVEECVISTMQTRSQSPCERAETYAWPARESRTGFDVVNICHDAGAAHLVGFGPGAASLRNIDSAFDDPLALDQARSYEVSSHKEVLSCKLVSELSNQADMSLEHHPEAYHRHGPGRSQVIGVRSGPQDYLPQTSLEVARATESPHAGSWTHPMD